MYVCMYAYTCTCIKLCVYMCVRATHEHINTKAHRLTKRRAQALLGRATLVAPATRWPQPQPRRRGVPEDVDAGASLCFGALGSYWP